MAACVCHLCVFGVLVCWSSACELFRNHDYETVHKQITNRQEHQTQISGRNSNGTKHSGGPPEDGREKRPKHVGVLYKHVLNILLVLNVEVIVF